MLPLELLASSHGISVCGQENSTKTATALGVRALGQYVIKKVCFHVEFENIFDMLRRPATWIPLRDLLEGDMSYEEVGIDLRYAIEEQDQVVVVRLQGDLWGKPEDLSLKQRIEKRAKKGARRFVIDFQEASALNSTGIGIVVSALTAIQAQGGRLRLTGMNSRIKSTFEITGISRMLSVYDTVKEAAETPWPR